MKHLSDQVIFLVTITYEFVLSFSCKSFRAACKRQIAEVDGDYEQKQIKLSPSSSTKQCRLSNISLHLRTSF